MVTKPAFRLSKRAARAITYLLLFTSFWYFDSFLGCLNSVAQAREKGAAAAAAVAPPVVFRVPQSTLPVTLTRISTGFNGLIGLDYHPPTDKVLASVNYGGGSPYNFELIDHDGNHSQFSNVSGLGDEVYIASVRDTLGGFSVGECFTGNGRAGEILKISPDGQTITNPWVKLPNEPGLLRGGLHVDRTGVFGGDLIVVTTGGGVWRINSQGQPSILANVHDLLEGPHTVPNDPVRYGPMAGRILAAAENTGRIYGIDPQGNVRFESVGGSPEGVFVVPPAQNFFTAVYGAGAIYGAPATSFGNMVGDIIYTEEFSGNISSLRWDGTVFQKTLIAKAPAQIEGSCFAPAGIVEVPPISPPPSITVTPPQTLNATSPDGAMATIAAQVKSQGCTVLRLTWKVDGLPVERIDTFPATGEPPSTGTSSWNRLYAPGPHTITAIVSDAAGQSASAQTTVTVNGQPPVKTLTSIDVTPPTSQIKIGQMVQLTATGTYSDGSTADITAQAGWSSDGAGIAQAQPGGVVKGVAPGTASITASLDGITGNASVTVVRSLVSIAVTPATSQLSIGQTVQLTATGTYDDGSSADITAISTWSSNATQFVKVDAGGLATAVAVGTAAITASLAGISGSAQVSVVRSLVSLSITPINPQILIGQTIQFTATGGYDDGTSADLTSQAVWASGTPGVATINGTGLATGLSGGQSAISATVGAISGSTTLTVLKPPPPTVTCTLARPMLWPPDHDLIDVGLTLQASSSATRLTLKVFSDEPEESQTGDGKFSPDARQFGPVTAGPIPLLLRAERKGNGDSRVYLVVVTATDDFGQTSHHCCPVIVPKNQSKKEIDAVTAFAAQAEASCGPDGSPLTPYLVGVGPNIGPKQGPCHAALVVTPGATGVQTGKTKQFTVTAYSGAGAPVPLPGPASWSSSTPQVSTVDGSGTATGRSQGTTRIASTSGGLTAFAALSVDPPAPTSIVVYPAIATLFEGSTWNYSALAWYPDGSFQDVTSQVIWSSSSTAKGTVNSAGLVSAVAGGTTTISATLSGLTGSGSLSIIAKEPTELNLFLPQTTLVIGQQMQPSLKAHYNDCSIGDVNNQAIWETSDPNVATLNNGVGYVITKGVGTTTITARLGSVVTSQVLTVVARAVVAVAVNPVNGQFRVNFAVQYGVAATWNDGAVSSLSATDLTWTTAGVSATITPRAVMTAFEPGQLYVRATLKSNPTITGFTLATIVPIVLQSITLTPPSTVHVTAGLTKQFSAQGNYSDGTAKDISSQVTWTVNVPQNSQVSATGLLTTYVAGQTTVIASLNGVVGSSFVVIDPAAMTSITIEPQDAQLIVGQLGQYAAVGHFTDGSTKNLTSTATWSSADAGIATVNTTGVVTAVAAGQTTISAAQGGMTGTTTLTVIPLSAVSVSVSPTNPQIVVGQTVQLQAVATMNDGSMQNVTGQAIWTSNAGSVATVNAGLVSGAAAGQAAITATFGAKSGSTTVTVTAQTRTLTSVQLTPGTSQLVVGQTLQYAVKAGYSDGTFDTVTTQSTWASLAPGVATVNQAGLATSVAVGTTQIQATFGGVTVGSTLSVLAAPKTLSSVAVLPGSATLSVGQAGQFLAQATYSDGSKQDVTTQSAWTSSVPTVATVGATTGIASANAAGGTTISATFGGKTGFAGLSVTAQTKTLTSITLFPQNPHLPATQTGQFQAVGTYSDGSQADVTLTSTWTSSAPSVATVSPSGLATALAIGTTTVTASQGGVSGSTIVTVEASSPPPTATIPNPPADTRIALPTTLVGTANSANFASYKLEYSLVGSGQFFQFGGGSAPITNGVLGTLDPTLLKNGIYTVRLTVNDTTGQRSEATVNYVVGGYAKIGIFTLTLTDLDLPVAGIPVTVNRVYDSRDRSSGDFGNGWNLDLRTLNIQESAPPGKSGWEVVPLNGGLLPEYQLILTKPRYVTVTLPDGRTETFDVTPPPDPQFDQNFWPAPTFSPRPGNTCTLKPVGTDDTVIIVGDNLEDFSFHTFEPMIYQLTLKEGTAFTFSLQFGLSQVKDTHGNTVTISSTGITSSSGPSVSFTRDSANRITQMADPLGQAIRYVYDSDGDLISSTDRAGNVTTYTYTQPGLLQDILDPLGRRPVRNDYDSAGRLIDTIDAAGNQVTYTHLPDTRQEIITDRNGNQTLYEYDDRGRIVAETDPLGGHTSTTFDDNDNVMTRTDALGRVTTFTYDSMRNLLSQSNTLGGSAIVTSYTYNALGQLLTLTDPMGHVTTNTYDAQGNLLTTTDALGHLTQNTYDSTGRLTAAVDPLGTRSEMDRDGAGNIVTLRIRSSTGILLRQTTFAYDANGRQTQQTLWNGTTPGVLSPYAVSTASYNANGQVVQATDPLGKSTFVTYDGAGQRTSLADKNGNVVKYLYNSLGLVETTEFPAIRIGTNIVTPTEIVTYDKNGNRTSTTDRNGNVTSTEFDKLNRAVKVTNPDGSFKQRVYDAAGRLVTQIDERGNSTSFSYDELGRQVISTDPLGKIVQSMYDASGRLAATIDAMNRTTSFEYDAAGHRTKTTFPDGSFATVVYDGRGKKVSETDEAGMMKKFVYAPTGELLEVQQPDPVNVNQFSTVTRFVYDALGRKLQETDALGRATQYAYTIRGEVATQTRPMGQADTFAYDAQGNLVSKVDALGQKILYQYNALNLLSAKLFADGSSNAFSYLPGGQRASATITSASGLVQTTTYGLDSRNRVTGQNNPDGTGIQWGYDAVGNRTSLQSPTQLVNYTYTPRNELFQVFRNGGATPWATYGYDDVGNRAQLSYANGTKAVYAYNLRNQLLSVQNMAGSSLMSSYSYTLDPRGLRISVTESGGRAVGYSYDNLRRLTQESITESGQLTTISYQLDAVGNRLQKAIVPPSGPSQVTTYTVNSNDQLVSENGPDGLIQYAYDVNGNQISKSSPAGVSLFSWDSERRLIAASVLGQQAQFSYDVDGMRTSRMVNGITMNYVLDKNRVFAQVLEERDSVGATQVTYTYGDDLLSQDRSSQVRFYHGDGQLSTRQLTDAAGSVVDQYTYDAFGTLLTSTGSTANAYLYGGEQFDPVVGLYYQRARYLDQRLGRFISTDPASGIDADPPTFHKYAYASADPINRRDPSGMQDLISTLQSIAIGTVVSHIASYAVHSMVSIFVPDFVLQGAPSAIRVGFTFQAGGAWNGIGAGVMGGVEILYFFQLHQLVFYSFLGGYAGIGGGTGDTGAVGGFSADIGLVYNTPTPDDYKGMFLSFGGSKELGGPLTSKLIAATAVLTTAVAGFGSIVGAFRNEQDRSFEQGAGFIGGLGAVGLSIGGLVTLAAGILQDAELGSSKSAAVFFSKSVPYSNGFGIGVGWSAGPSPSFQFGLTWYWKFAEFP